MNAIALLIAEFPTLVAFFEHNKALEAYRQAQTHLEASVGKFLEEYCAWVGLFIACVDAEPCNQTMDAVAESETAFTTMLMSNPPSIVQIRPWIGYLHG